MLAKNLKELRGEKTLTQGAVAKAVGVSRSSYAAYEAGKSEPVASVLAKMASFFKVKADDLLNGLVPPPLFRSANSNVSLQNDNIRIVTVLVDNQQRENILYVPEAAIAGYLSDHNQPEYISQLPHFRLPKFNSGTYRAFDIQGDSMPPLHDGYVLIGKFVEQAQDIKSGNRYVLVIKDRGIAFKKVVRDEGKRTQPEKAQFILMSDNPDFLPYTVDVSDILEAWEMVAFIGCPDVYQDNTYLINERLQVIEQKLNFLNAPL